MPCVKRCCCCVTLRLGGITMGIMTLALSAFSIIPMAISFVHRVFLAQVVTHLLNEFRKEATEATAGNEGTIIVYYYFFKNPDLLFIFRSWFKFA